MSDAGRLLAAYGALGATHNKLAAVREFADGLLAYEAAHAAGVDTPIVIAIANDLLAMLDDGERS